jgi:nucleoside-diphosphate-sugar epimerase
MRIAVTGASGFIGGVIASALAMPEFDHEVIGYGRTPGGWSYRNHVANAGHYRIWDVTGGRLPTDTRVDAVVHCAALADDWATLGESLRVNREGTRNVVRSFAGARFVHLSTSSVYDAFVPTVNALESQAPATRFLSSYSQSKAAAEAELIGIDAVILRPHAVYGPRDTTLLPRLLAGIRRGRLTLPEGAAVLHTLTHIDNLVAAVVLALEPEAPAGVFNIGDDAPVLLSDVLTELLAKKGRSDVTLRRIPYRAAFALASVVELGHRVSHSVGHSGRPRVTRYAVSQLGLERTLDLTAARKQLGYRPKPTSLAGAERW